MSYIIAGRAIKSEYLSLGTLLGTAAIAGFAMSGGSKEKPASSITATAASPSRDVGKFNSSEEEDFIRNFIAEAEKADKAGKH